MKPNTFLGGRGSIHGGFSKRGGLFWLILFSGALIEKRIFICRWVEFHICHGCCQVDISERKSVPNRDCLLESRGLTSGLFHRFMALLNEQNQTKPAPSIFTWAVGNDHFCDKTERACQRPTPHNKGGDFPLSHKSGDQPLAPTLPS